MTAGVRWLGAVGLFVAFVLPAAAQTMTDADKAAFAGTLMDQLSAHWPEPSTEADVVITVAIAFSPDGRISQAQLMDVRGSASDEMRAEVLQGIKAALQHFAQTPFENLPLAHYEEWRSMTLRFHTTPPPAE